MNNGLVSSISGSVPTTTFMTAACVFARGSWFWFWLRFRLVSSFWSADDFSPGCYIQPELRVIMWSLCFFLAIFPCHAVHGLTGNVCSPEAPLLWGGPCLLSFLALKKCYCSCYMFDGYDAMPLASLPQNVFLIVPATLQRGYSLSS